MLALIFMTVVSLIVLAMAAWTTTGLRSSIDFTQAQQTVASANSLAQLALQESRYTFQPGTLLAQPPVSCWGTGATPPTINNLPPMSAWCSTRWNPSSVKATRRVTIYVCPTSLSPSAPSDCASTPYLQVIATFDDYSASGGSPQCTDGPTSASWVTCGTYMSINSWVFTVTPPTVRNDVTPFQSGYPPSATCTTTSFTLYGTGFLVGSTNVYFITTATTTISGTTTTVRYSQLATNVAVYNNTTLSGCAPPGPGTATLMVSTPVGQSSQAVTISY